MQYNIIKMILPYLNEEIIMLKLYLLGICKILNFEGEGFFTDDSIILYLIKALELDNERVVLYSTRVLLDCMDKPSNIVKLYQYHGIPILVMCLKYSDRNILFYTCHLLLKLVETCIFI